MLYRTENDAILNELTTAGRTVRLDFAFADGKEDGKGA